MHRALSLWLAMQPPTEDLDGSRRAALERMNEAVDAFLDEQMSEAERGLRDAINLDPRYAAPHINLARLQFARGRYADAAAEYQRAIALTPELRGELSYERGVTLEAAAALPDLPSADRRSGLLAAAEAYADAVAADPRDDRAQHRRGAIHDRLGQPTQAEAGYRGCIEARPTELRCFVALAQLYADYGFGSEALAVLEAGVEINAIEAEMWIGAAKIRLQLGEAKSAADAAKRAMTIDPDLVDPHYLRGMAAIELHDRKLAIESFSSFLQRPGHAEHPGAGEARARLDQLRTLP